MRYLWSLIFTYNLQDLSNELSQHVHFRSGCLLDFLVEAGGNLAYGSQIRLHIFQSFLCLFLPIEGVKSEYETLPCFSLARSHRFLRCPPSPHCIKCFKFYFRTAIRMAPIDEYGLVVASV